METIASFQVDHIRMSRGVFVSRIDRFGDTVLTTFDIRLKEPNREPVVDIPALHTLEHLGAVFLRSHAEWGSRVVYFGPMGCRTGLYVILEGEHSSRDVLPLMVELFQFVSTFSGEIPGAAPEACGNWKDHNQEMAAWEARRFLAEILTDPARENLEYPPAL